MPSASANSQNVIISDGSMSFDGGVDSISVSTLQSTLNANGLMRNQLAWLINAGVRDGGVTQRSGWKKLLDMHDGSALFQGGFIYEPTTITGGFPYLIALIGGNLWRFDPRNALPPVNLSLIAGLTMPPSEPHAYFVQAEEFLVVQAGDYVTLPLFWDGTTLRRSVGLIPTGAFVENVAVTSAWVVPAVGSNVILNVTAPYGGAVGQQTVWKFQSNGVVVGEFKIINVLATTLEIQTTATSFEGATMDAGVYQVFTATDTVSEIPAAGPMDYYMGRIWYGIGRQVNAGDIVFGTSGTLAYNFRDSVLKITENPAVLAGDGFTVPSNAGNITAIKHSANLDATLGEGRLFISTRRVIYSLQVPVTRDDWIAADNNNEPRMTVVQLVNGMVGDRSVVPVNGDLFYQSLEPGIRSLISAIRYFQQWGNTPISANETRLIQFNDRALLNLSSGITFDNRLLQSALPRQTPQGVVHDAIVPLDFIPVSSFGKQSNPIWQGMFSGIPILQMWTADFGGLERAFAAVVSRADSSIQLWELTQAEKFENGDNRVQWQIEFPAYTWGKEFLMKRLVSAELWIDRLYGEVIFKMEYRPDSDPCWYTWHQWKWCSARNSCEDVFNPICYPITPFSESFRSTATLPTPPESCASISGRPAYIGYQFQPRLTITGFCRVRGILLHALTVDRELYKGIVC